MPQLPQAREGERLETLRQPTPFSFWPTRRPRAHARIQPILFSLDPWMLLQEEVEQSCNEDRRAEVLACLAQSKDFFVVGTDKGIEAARPLALYYSYLNLSKALCLTRGNASTFDKAQHGLREQPSAGGRTGLDYSQLTAFPSPNGNGRLQVFDELLNTIKGAGIGQASNFELKFLLPQILSGHRLWAQAAGQRERFISFHDIQFWRNKNTREVWLRLYLVAHDLSRLRISRAEFLTRSGLGGDFREVRCSQFAGGQPLLCFEQIVAVNYPANHPADVLDDLVKKIKPHLWTTIATVSPYRRYYAYLCPQQERNSLLPQILSTYALTYYLGSITRYRPQDFDGLAHGKFGPRIQDFVTGQPLQFLYLMASEFTKREITKPSIL